MKEELHYNLHITGRVQGVGFRRHAQNEARYLGLKGFVRNLSDGSVYIEAEGTPDRLSIFIQWCRKSPGFSYVDSVIVESAPLRGLTGFHIKY